MNPERKKLIWIIGGATLFNLLFWNEKMAINTALYDLFLILVLFLLYPKARHSSTVRWLLAGHLICLAMIVVHNTLISKLAFSITLLLLVTFVQYVHRSIWFATGSLFQNIVFVIPGFFEALERPEKKKSSGIGISKAFRFAVFPLLLAFTFFIIYSLANSVFSTMVNRLLNQLQSFVINFFDFFSWKRLIFFLLGLFVTSVILIRSKLNYFSVQEQSCNDELIRHKKSRIERQRELLYDMIVGLMGKFASGIMALKNLNTMGLISLILLNILLMIVNAIDISYVWIGFEPMQASLYEVIHEGTNLQILSILLAILVLLIFFKGNLNFYAGNKRLKQMAYLWILQNMILTVSVFMRDYFYINEAGLGRNRIGILFYLALVLVGLVTVFWKVYRQKTIYYLFRVNAWAALVLLVGATTINWDEFIVKYNFSRRNEIVMPVTYMVTLSDKVLPILYSNKEELKRHEKLMKLNGFWDYRDCDGCWIETLDGKVEEYKKKQASYSWLSWNAKDAALEKYFRIEKNSK